MSNTCMYVAACVYKLLKTFPRATLFQNYCNLNLVSFNEIKKKKKEMVEIYAFRVEK